MGALHRQLPGASSEFHGNSLWGCVEAVGLEPCAAVRALLQSPWSQSPEISVPHFNRAEDSSERWVLTSL